MSARMIRPLFASKCGDTNTNKGLKMAESTIWWLLAGALIAVELLTGTFYLLMLSIGLVAGAISAHLGAAFQYQLVIAALVGGGSVVVWRSLKQNSASPPPANANHDVNMDVGETLHVEAWDAEGNGNAQYRGANWQVTLAPDEAPLPGKYKIVEVVGSRFIVKIV